MNEAKIEDEPGQASERPEVPKVGAEQLLDAVNTASGHCHTLYYSFLVLMLFVAVIVGSTKDVQLLLQSPLTLPIVGIGVPIVGVYVIVPPLFVILHFNLFLQLYLLSRKANGFERKMAAIKSAAGAFADEDLLRERADPFALTQLLIGGRHRAGIRLFLWTIVTTVMVVFPLALMLWIQIRFLPYHDPWINILHAALTTMDLAMCWYFWPRILGRGRGVWDLPKETRRTPMGLARLSLAGGLSLACVYVIAFVAVVPDTKDRHGLEWLFGCHTEQNLLDMLSPGYGGLRYLDVAEASLVLKSAPAEILAAAAAQGETAVEDAKVRYAAGLDLRGFDLRRANFSKSTLYNADLRGTDLQGANLSYAKLNGVSLKGDKKTKEADANLAGAILLGIDLQNQDLSSMDLRGANLHKTNLKGANLSKTQLQGADLEHAELQGANLYSAQLQGARLRGADLHGAKLHHAQIQCADLSNTRLSGAEMYNAQLQGADLWEANLEGTNLESVNLQGANGTSANLIGANLAKANLQGVVLLRALLVGADLGDAKLQGAYLGGANLRGAGFERAELYGVHLSAADVSMVDFSYVSFTEPDPEVWRRIRFGISSKVPEGGRRDKAIERIEEAMKRKTVIEPSSAKDTRYDHENPVFASMAERWKPLSGMDEAREFHQRIGEFLVSLSCREQHVAKSIARRLLYREESSAARALLEKREAVQARVEQCEGLKGIPEKTWTRLQKMVN